MSFEAIASITIRCAPERVFDFVTRPEAVAETFRGHGLVPGARRSSVVGGGAMRVGAIRRVENVDGTEVHEEILELDRPRAQRYRLIRGLPGWLLRGAEGAWWFEPAPEGTRVRWVFTLEPASRLVRPIAAILRRSFEKAMQATLDRTRDACEQASS